MATRERIKEGVLKLQTERIDNHRAQFTIEIETDQLEDAKRKAARKISRHARIKGFRKGKAPYGLVVRHVGEGAVLEEALDALGDRLYKQALDESEVIPYGPGAFEDFNAEPVPTFVFSTPLAPEVDLKDYLDVRLDFEAPAVTEGEVDDALQQIRMRSVETLDEDIAVTALGHRVTIDVDSEFVDGDPPDETEEAPAEDALTDQAAEAEDAPYVPKRGDTFVTDRDRQIILDPNEDPFTQGFVGNLIGVERGSDVEFELTIPDDDAEETIIGRRVWFVVTVRNIEAVSIPDLDDEFARQACRDRGDEEQDLAGLRQLLQDEMTRRAQDAAREEYSGEVLTMIVDGAEIEYPDMMVDEHIDGMVSEFEGRLRQGRVKLDDYLRVTEMTKDDLREQYRESAVVSVRHALVLREFARVQEIEASDDDLELRLQNVMAGYGESPEVRKLFDTPQMRGNLRNELVMNFVNAHLAAIGQGQDPGVAVDEARARMKADTKLASERRERLDRYQEEDDAASESLTAESDADEARLAPGMASAPPVSEPSPALEAAEPDSGKP